jgi:hypothetical protein
LLQIVSYFSLFLCFSALLLLLSWFLMLFLSFFLQKIVSPLLFWLFFFRVKQRKLLTFHIVPPP